MGRPKGSKNKPSSGEGRVKAKKVTYPQNSNFILVAESGDINVETQVYPTPYPLWTNKIVHLRRKSDNAEVILPVMKDIKSRYFVDAWVEGVGFQAQFIDEFV